MNPKDIEVLNELRKNSRGSLTDIGFKTEMPLSTVFKRVMRLEDKTISRYVSLMNFEAIGYPLKVAAFITTKSMSEANEWLMDHPNINNLFKLTEGRLYAELLFKSWSDYEDFMDNLTENKAIGTVKTHFMTDIKQETFKIPGGE